METLPLLSKILPWLLLIGTLILTLAAIHFNRIITEREARRAFDARADGIVQAIQIRLQTVEQLLQGGASLLGAVPDATRKTWRSYVGTLDVSARYRDLLGVGYVRWVKPDDLAEHIRAVRSDGAPRYGIVQAADRSAYAPVVYLEPSTGSNLRAIGYDMFSDPARLAALMAARDAGTIAISPPVQVDWDVRQARPPGVLMFLPVYRRGAPHQDIDQRRAALLGFVYGSLRIYDVVQGLFPGGFPDVDIDLFDEAAPSATSMLYRNDSLAKNAGPDDAPAFTVTRDIPLYGRVWTLQVASRNYRDIVTLRLNALSILGAGTIAGLLLFYLGWSIANSRRRAMMLAKEMTAALQASESRLRLITDNIPALIAYTSRDKRFIFGNRRYQDAFGVNHTDLTGMRTQDVLGDAAYAQSAAHIDDVLKGNYAQFERTVHFKGETRWERVSYAPDIQADGTVAGFFSLVEDITELKQIQSTLASSELHLRTITDNLPAMIAYIDADLRYRFCNTRYRALVGYHDRPLLGLSVPEAINPETYRHVRDYMARALQGDPVTFDRHVTEIDPPRHLHYDYSPDRAADGRVLGFYTMIVDVTERKEAELRQAASEKLLRGVTDHLPALVSFIDRNERFLFNNAPFEQWLKRPLSEITGRRVDEVYSAEEYEIFSPVVKTTLGGTLAQRDFELVLHDEKRHYRATSVPQFNERGEVYDICNMISDITAIKQVEMRLSEMARTDSLTALPNRNAIGDKLNEAMARSRRSGSSMAIMFLDIDRFKHINDTYGHHCGDLVLVEFARRLQAAVRATDTVGRLASDEFVIIAEGLRQPDESCVIAEKIVQAMGKPFSIDGMMHQFSTSIGIAFRRADETDGQRVLKRADEALYQAKAAGRNRFAILD